MMQTLKARGIAAAATMTLALALSAGWTVTALAQAQKEPASPAPAAKPTAQAPATQSSGGGPIMIEGKVQKVMGSKITLDNGTELTLPAALQSKHADLKAGTSVKAAYEEKGGQKMVTDIVVEPGSKPAK